MIGALDYDEGLMQTLKNNGIGILVSTLTGLKESKEMFKSDFPQHLEPSGVRHTIQESDIVLEGGNKASKLRTVAPFAQRVETRRDVGDYVDIPDARHYIKEFNKMLSRMNIKNKKVTAEDFAYKIGAGNLPEFAKLVDEMRIKYSDDEFVGKLMFSMLKTSGFKFEDSIDILKRLVTEYDATPENKTAMSILMRDLVCYNPKVIETLIDLPKERGTNERMSLQTIADTAEILYIDSSGFKAFERALKIKDENGNYAFEPKDLSSIDYVNKIVSDNSFTDNEIILLMKNIDDFFSVDTKLTISSLLASNKFKPKLKALLSSKEINPDEKYKFINELSDSLLYKRINEIKDKHLRSFVKRNLHNIEDKQKRMQFFYMVIQDFENLSDVKDKYLMSKIYTELAKFADNLNKQKGTVDWTSYEDIKRYIPIDKEIRGESVAPIYGNASEYLSYLEKEYPEYVTSFEHLVKKYENLPFEDYKDYVDKYFKNLSEYTEIYANVPNYVKDKKIQNLRNYFNNTHIKTSGSTDAIKQNKTVEKIYKEKYLPLLSESARERCEKIYDSFGVKMLLVDESSLKELDFVYNELQEWQKAGKGRAKFPNIIDLSNIKQSYIRIDGGVAGYYNMSNNNVSVSTVYFSDLVSALRHEIAHANDSLVKVDSGIIKITGKDGKIEEFDIDNIIVHKKIQKLDENGRPMFNSDGTPVMVIQTYDDGLPVVDFDKSLYFDEFVNAGIDKEYIEYAYTNKAEFVAVAAEGDFSKYSKEFKDILVKFGMPEWMFAMKPKNNMTASPNTYFETEFSAKFTPEENRKIYENTEKFFNHVAKNQADVYADYQKLFGSDLQCRIKDFKGLNEKIYRQINKLDKKIEDLKDIDKYNVEKLKPGQEPLTREAADILIEKYTLQRQNMINDYDPVYSSIQDAYGARVVLDDASAESIAKVHKSLLDAVDSGDIKLLEINNYQGEDSTPYFTSAQIKQLQAHCSRQGYELKVISNVNAPKGRENSYRELYNQNEAIKKAGYTTCQMNIQHKNGIVSEFQIRGKYINELAESEHVYYDLSEGKDIGKDNPAIEKLVEPLKGVVVDMNKPENSQIKTAYLEYLSSCYKYARMQELGIPMDKPVLPPSVNKLLDIENIIAIHSKISALK